MDLEQIKDYFDKFKDKELNKEILECLSKQKKIEVENNEQLKAKEIWCLEQVYKIIDDYLMAFKELKDSKFFEAWCSLDRVDITFSFLRKHFNYTGNKYNLEFIEKKVKEFQKLFPYKCFMSRESVIKKERCSICNKIVTLRKFCGHKVGEIYNGEQCFRLVEEVEFLGVAIVKDPFDKYAVVFPEGKEYNYYMLEQLISHLKNPFEDWELKIEKRIKREYIQLGRNSNCVCGSGKKFKKCCLKTGENLYNHNRIILLDEAHVGMKPINNVQVNSWKGESHQ
ncbi:SEC-C metal-binding domain-containing protein [Priestia megaterium]|uniref:SEC-C metal-binding domain-containing protein n=1 Tax=Priestia megaterium TaxID=1404 RepID=UPI000D2238DD|nr:zinc chelation protein SecC [Bacillus sp. Y-01]